MTNSSALWAALDILNINVPGSKQWKVKSCVYWQALRITYSHSSKAKEAKQFLLQSSNSAQRQKASLAKNGSVPSAISVLLFCLSACLGSACIFGTSATSTPATATSTSDSRQQLQLQLKLPLPQTYAYPRPRPLWLGLTSGMCRRFSLAPRQLANSDFHAFASGVRQFHFRYGQNRSTWHCLAQWRVNEQGTN